MLPGVTLHDFAGQTAIITGAGSLEGIGFATAQMLGALGATVVLAATTERIYRRAAELNTQGIDAVAVMGDLTRADDADRLIQAALTRTGRIDVLVNNAGMISKAQPNFESGTIAQISEPVWHQGLARNLDPAYLVTQGTIPVMVDRHFGRIIMVSSVTGPVMAMSGDIAYATAKAGLVGLTRALAVDHAADGITVNAVAPGWIATGSQTRDEQRQGQHTPMRRSGTPAEVATAIVALASPGASYITGQCLTVDGGNSIAEQRAAP